MDKIIRIVRTVLIIFFIVWIIVWYSIRSFNHSKGKDYSLLNKVVVELYKTPGLIKDWFKEDIKFSQAIKIKNSNDLFQTGNLKNNSKIPDSIYLLFSKSLDKSNAQVLLENIKTGKIIKSWSISLDLIMKDFDSTRADIKNMVSEGIVSTDYAKFTPNNTFSISINSPIMLKDSSLIFHPLNFGYIYKIDKDSKLIWKSKRRTHHSIELDENKNIWTVSLDHNRYNTKKFKYRDDAVLCLNSNGEEIFFESLTKIFKNNNLFTILIESTPIAGNGSFGLDPFHLNDVQPVNRDSPYWKKGDLFLSIRNKSMIVLFRPGTGKIIWIKQGPWIQQHDINIENDSIISIFNNNTSFFNNKVNVSSNIAYYNFRSGKVNFFANGIFGSVTEGRQVKLLNGDLLVEETNKALFYLIDSTGSLKEKFYIPFQLDSTYAQYPNWARIYYRD
jgi:outer membrane protein assembly factor BamB